MQKGKKTEVIVTTKIEKQVYEKLKKNARQNDLLFSKYVKRILVKQTERKQKESN